MNSDKNIAGVVLAGGLARRMGGGDKTLLDLGGKPILAHVLARLWPQVSQVILNANGDIDRFSEFDLPVVTDSISDFAGPLAGVLAGMDWAAKNGFSRIVTVAGDTPFFPEQLVMALGLGMESEQTPLAMAVSAHQTRGLDRHPTFGIWDVGLRENLRAALDGGVRKVVQWTMPTGCANVFFDGFADDPFFNINTPDDLARAKEILAQREHLSRS